MKKLLALIALALLLSVAGSVALAADRDEPVGNIVTPDGDKDEPVGF
jgi:hypothetical protein